MGQNAVIALIVDNSYSQLSGLNSQQFQSLRQELSYMPANSYFAGRAGVRSYLIDTKGVFPSGLVSRVEAWCQKNKVEFLTVGTLTLPTPSVSFKAAHIHKPYEDQLAAVSAAMGVRRGILSLPTGTGKSFVIGLLIASRKLRTLCVVPTLELKRQLWDTLLSVLGPGALNHVDIEHIGATRLKHLNNYDMLIIDEAHHSAARTYRKLNKTAWKDIYYRYCFTATPFRSQEEEQILMESVTGPVIYTLTYPEALSKGYIVPVQSYYLDLPKTEVKGHSWKQVYDELVVNNKFRNEEIGMILANLHSKQKAALVLVKEIEHGDNLVKLTGAAFANGESGDASELIDGFNNRKLGVLIGTTGVLAEGVDTRPAEYIIIAGLGKSRSAFMQAVGRAVRRYPGKESAKVVILRDPSHRWTLNHYNEQRKILREYYGTEPIKL